MHGEVQQPAAVALGHNVYKSDLWELSADLQTGPNRYKDDTINSSRIVELGRNQAERESVCQLVS